METFFIPNAILVCSIEPVGSRNNLEAEDKKLISSKIVTNASFFIRDNLFPPKV
jgi:hypothetical protein